MPPNSKSKHHLPHQRVRRSRALWLYLLAILREFRYTLAALVGAVVLGALLVRAAAVGSDTPMTFGQAAFNSWMMLLAQQQNSPSRWYVSIITAIYPLLGLMLFGEGVVRLALLMVSRRRGEKEWMRVMASTYRDHVVLCGLGHLGIRVLEQLVASDVPVVVIELDANGRFVARAKEMNVPLLICDMKEDKALIEAGIPVARSVIIATNDDMANLEVALDSRRMNPQIRVIMRLFDQQIAGKISNAFFVDRAFSASTLSAPMVAAMSLDSHVLSSYVRDGIQQVVAEFEVESGSNLAGLTIPQLEKTYDARVLTHHRRGAADNDPLVNERLAAGDMLSVHLPASKLTLLAAASRAAAA